MPRLITGGCHDRNKLASCKEMVYDFIHSFSEAKNERHQVMGVKKEFSMDRICTVCLGKTHPALSDAGRRQDHLHMKAFLSVYIHLVIPSN